MQQHGASATRRVQRFATLISDIVYEIFFVPKGFGDFVARTLLRVPQRVDGAHGSLDAMEAPEPPEVPDADGLTDSEFRIVSARARDPSLNKKDRADAAMMVLFGTRRKYFCMTA